ncbi:MAG TPA: hypothetical protein DCP28_30840, partial [Cytophagales bacterium]|nr:hypothetical protein [Cytophagales bacterium]
DNNWSAGLGFSYQYLRFNDFDLNSNVFGGRLFLRRNLVDQFFAWAEYESLSLEFFNTNDNRVEREFVSGLFIGAGYFVPVGRRSQFIVALLYNLQHDNFRSPYSSPIVVRGYFTF